LVGLFATLELNTNMQQAHNSSIEIDQILEKGHSYTVNTSSDRPHATKPGQPTIEYSDQIIEFNFGDVE
jgi:hypothetical protein